MTDTSDNRGFAARMFGLDRRWAFLFLAAVVVVTVVVRPTLPIPISREARRIYDFLNSLQEGEYIHLALDYDPPLQAELHPMTLSVLKQCFERKIKVIITTLHHNGAVMAATLIDTACQRHVQRTAYLPQSGVDWVYLGYKPLPEIVILGMGQNYRIPYPNDYDNVPVDSLPMMRGIRNLQNVRAIINISGTDASDWWILYGNGRYRVPLALGLTGVLAADYYPYLQTGQVFGLLGGLQGAAEYETLVNAPGKAVAGMPVQVAAHLVMIAFILIGNIGYFVSQRKAGARAKR